jgi:hypothetical protein
MERENGQMPAAADLLESSSSNGGDAALASWRPRSVCVSWGFGQARHRTVPRARTL